MLEKKNRLSVSETKIESVLNFPRPQSLRALRSVLGLANYFREFLSNHSAVVAPVQRLVDSKAHKKSPIIWTPSAILAFQHVKVAISRCP